MGADALEQVALNVQRRFGVAPGTSAVARWLGVFELARDMAREEAAAKARKKKADEEAAVLDAAARAL